jgi:hypothetical protein
MYLAFKCCIHYVPEPAEAIATLPILKCPSNSGPEYCPRFLFKLEKLGREQPIANYSARRFYPKRTSKYVKSNSDCFFLIIHIPKVYNQIRDFRIVFVIRRGRGKEANRIVPVDNCPDLQKEIRI